MEPLSQQLLSSSENLRDFGRLTKRTLYHLPDVLNTSPDFKAPYRLPTASMGSTTKSLRPVNEEIFINEAEEFEEKFQAFLLILEKARNEKTFDNSEYETVDQVSYTIQQSIGLGLDLWVNPNSARKHMGNRFEELIRAIFNELGVAHKRVVLKIPYETEEGTKTYKCENDLVLSPHSEVRSTSTFLDPDEVVLSVKTSSKDRLGKLFIDKMLMERFVGHRPKVVGIFLNDVQRKAEDNISYTLVSGLFMVYTNFLVPMDGLYYMDPPPNARQEPCNQHMKRFSQLVLEDLHQLLTS